MRQPLTHFDLYAHEDGEAWTDCLRTSSEVDAMIDAGYDPQRYSKLHPSTIRSLNS